ncbi:MAG: porin family protein [Bacteroidota bacterium]|jgi:Outer membrane protein beta-barrel domain
MRKKLFCFAVICLLPLQLVLAQKSPEIKLGLKIAPNISFINPSTSGYTYDGVKLGAVIGLVSDFYFAERYAFSTGLNFSLLGGKIEYPNQVKSDTTYLKGTTKSNMSFVYLEIPLMIKMFTKKFGAFSFFGQVGFGTSFRIAAHATNEFTGDKGYTSTEKKDMVSKTTLIRESVLIGIGSEVYLDQSTRLFFGLGYSNSLNNVLNGADNYGINQKAYLNYAELNLGVMF